MTADEQSVYATIREIRDMLVLGGLSASEEAGLKARLRRLRDEYGDPPDEPPPASDPIRSDPILVGAEDRTSLWLRLAQLNGEIARNPSHELRRQLDNVALRLGIEDRNAATALH